MTHRKMVCSTFIMLLILVSCQKQEKVESIVLKDELQDIVGVAVNQNAMLSDSIYNSTTQIHFDRLTPENVMKFETIHPEENTYNFKPMDQLVEFARQNNLEIHGHCLIWGKQLPEWIISFKGSKQEWLNIMENHIQNIITHYKDDINSWDVVNEAFNEDGSYKRNIWFKNIGVDYISWAFIYAHQADPTAQLFYNDFNLLSNSIKREKVIDQLTSLKKNLIPIDGIGAQAHLTYSIPDNYEIEKAFDAFRSSDFHVHISELDVSINPTNENLTNKEIEEREKRQISQFCTIFKSYETLKNHQRFGITLWGVSDQYSWLKKQNYEAPLLFDSKYKLKSNIINAVLYP